MGDTEFAIDPAFGNHNYCRINSDKPFCYPVGESSIEYCDPLVPDLAKNTYLCSHACEFEEGCINFNIIGAVCEMFKGPICKPEITTS